MASRNRIIYASQSVVVDGDFLYRVQTLGSTTTFTSEDIFELGRQDIVDVVDDVPTVAITLETNDWGSIDTIASLGNVCKERFTATASGSATHDWRWHSNLVSTSGTTDIAYYHGVALSDFGEDAQFDLWSAVQTESSLGTTSDNIDQSLYMSDCYVTSIECGYSAGGNATENYAAEGDAKTWFLNDGRFISQEEWHFGAGDAGTSSVTLGIDDAAATPEAVATLSDSTPAFLYTTTGGDRALRFYDQGTDTWTNYKVNTSAATSTEAYYNSSDNTVTLPTGITVAAEDRLHIRYAANNYAGSVHGDSTYQYANYFTALADGDTTRPEDVGALRQGQVEIYLVDPDVAGTASAYEMMLRIQSCTITATLNREALAELGHLKPYDRPLTYPVEITVAAETTAGDLEMFSKFAGKEAEYDASTLNDVDIYHLMAKDNMCLVVMVYQQTDEDAGGTASNRKVLTTEMVGTEYFIRGARSTYAAINLSDPEREYPLKTIIVPSLKCTEEAYSLSVGSNASQTFSFRAVNKMYWVKGYVDIADIPGVCTPGLEKNS